MYKHLVLIVTLLLICLTVRPVKIAQNTVPEQVTTGTMSLTDRAKNSWVNTVFKKNILLTLSYLAAGESGKKHLSMPANTYQYDVVLKPNEVFAFHSDVLPKYKNKVIKTTNATIMVGKAIQHENSYGSATLY